MCLLWGSGWLFTAVILKKLLIQRLAGTVFIFRGDSRSGTMHVSLAEALEVRGGPLQEEEVWAVLSQSAESLHELMRTDPSALGFIISPWSLLLMPSGNISFTDENVTQQDLRAFTAPEILEGLNLSSVSDIEKVGQLGAPSL
ncbi:hypothetical protein MHYP_G00207110 [Metynnis hypsauchen]